MIYPLSLSSIVCSGNIALNMAHNYPTQTERFCTIPPASASPGRRGCVESQDSGLVQHSVGIGKFRIINPLCISPFDGLRTTPNLGRGFFPSNDRSVTAVVLSFIVYIRFWLFPSHFFQQILGRGVVPLDTAHLETHADYRRT